MSHVLLQCQLSICLPARHFVVQTPSGILWGLVATYALHRPVCEVVSIAGLFFADKATVFLPKHPRFQSRASDSADSIGALGVEAVILCLTVMANGGGLAWL